MQIFWASSFSASDISGALAAFPYVSFHLWTPAAGVTAGVAYLDGRSDPELVAEALEGLGITLMSDHRFPSVVPMPTYMMLNPYVTGLTSSSTTGQTANAVNVASGNPMFVPKRYS